VYTRFFSVAAPTEAAAPITTTMAATHQKRNARDSTAVSRSRRSRGVRTGSVVVMGSS
jgi:hypothetical protein